MTDEERESVLAGIARSREETQKFVAEQHKLLAEARKYNRESWILPFSVFGAVLAALIARLPEILHAFGVGR
jgi:hypothetical protein